MLYLLKKSFALLAFALCCMLSSHAQGNKRAMVFGITGQDGSYLAELLLEKGYLVYGCKRRSSPMNTEKIAHLMGNKNFKLHYTDITDSSNIIRLLQEIQPDEIYNLAAQSHVGVSFDLPEYTANSDALGTLRILEAIRLLGLTKKTKFYQASTSELYGKVTTSPQSETTPFYPQSPYGVAKLYAYWITINYRESYGIFAVNGILFNHESPRRGEHFVTKKITRTVAEIQQGKQDVLTLGNLDAQRDWGYAPDYVEAMWRMLQQETPQDLVIATGETHSVREFVEKSFKEIGVELAWHGSGIDEVGTDTATGKVMVKINPKFFRPTEVNFFRGNTKKAYDALGWKAQTSFDDLVKIMMKSDCEELSGQAK